MINGTVFSPFLHDSSWPDKELGLFREAVYYAHVHVPGRSPLEYIRELTNIKRSLTNLETHENWMYVNKTCSKAIHLAIKNIHIDEEMKNFTINMLVFTNFLLIADHGIIEGLCMTPNFQSEKMEKQQRATSQRLHEDFLNSINERFESLKSALDDIEKRRNRRGKLDLDNASVKTFIPEPFNPVYLGDVDGFSITVPDRDSDVFLYSFYPHEPIGWELISGISLKDRFANDVTAKD